jgi:hypothetical protein
MENFRMLAETLLKIGYWVTLFLFCTGCLELPEEEAGNNIVPFQMVRELEILKRE